jgi:2'-hydroxyisoflavone reductase
VADVCGYYPRQVRASLQALKGRARLYLFVSTVSVYREFQDGGDERAPTHEPVDEGAFPEKYGALKRGCERAVELGWDGPSLIARPGLVAGPHDPTDRFTYWAQRVPEGGRVLAPGAPERVAQFIDARDLGAWLAGAAAEGLAGHYNLCGPALRMEAALGACAGEAAWGTVWAGDDFLLARGVKPYSGMPLWIPGRVAAFDASKAVAAGLRCRGAKETAADTLRWHRERGSPALKAGLSRETEARLLSELEAAR